MRNDDPLTSDREPATTVGRERRFTGLQAVVLVASLALGLAVGSLRRNEPAAQTQASAQHPAVTAKAPQPREAGRAKRQQEHREPTLASFGDSQPSGDVRHVANWVVDSGDNHGKAIVIIDKKNARVWVLDPRGGLVADTPALLGAAVGDDPVPGIGDKPLAQVLPEEKTTPAGRYEAEIGENANHEDVVWVSWDLAVSMHRVRPLVKAERRLERLASPSSEDNRISFGCINLPVTFYEQVLHPVVQAMGAVVYVLPETRTPQEQFGSYEVEQQPRLALAHILHVK